MECEVELFMLAAFILVTGRFLQVATSIIEWLKFVSQEQITQKCSSCLHATDGKPTPDSEKCKRCLPSHTSGLPEMFE